MTASSQLLDYAHRVRTLDTFVELYASFEAFIRSLGFTDFLYSNIPAGPVDIDGFLSKALRHCSVPGMVRDYALSEAFGNDCVVEQLARGSLPFTVAQASRLHDNPLRYLEILDEIGMSKGLAIPYQSDGDRYGVSLFSEGSHAALHRLVCEKGFLGQAGALAMHERALELGNTEIVAKPLSPRECECLTWAARGKTAWEISVILSVSERTVKFHLSNASAKLRVNNTTHAVARAINAGIISL